MSRFLFHFLLFFNVFLRVDAAALDTLNLAKNGTADLLFTREQLHELEIVLDSARSQYANNLTAIEKALQSILVEQTRTQHSEVPIAEAEMKVLHAKLENLGTVLNRVNSDYELVKMNDTDTQQPLAVKKHHDPTTIFIFTNAAHFHQPIITCLYFISFAHFIGHYF